MTETAILALMAAVLGSGGIGAIVTAWISKRGTSEHALIDQLQEMVDTQAKRQADAATEAKESQRREASLLNYIWVLQGHINSDQPPPPPAWPDDLKTR